MNSINGMINRAFNETVQYDVEVKLRTPFLGTAFRYL